MAVWVCGTVGEIDLGGLEFEDSLIDRSLLALGAAQGDRLPVGDQLRAVERADDCGQSEFPADDGRVAGGASIIGDQARGLLHDRHPVRIGRFGHQDRALAKPIDVGGAVDDAGLADGNRLADRGARDDQFAFLRQAVGFQQGVRFGRLHRLGAGLDEVEFAGVAVLGPFDVHGPPVVRLDRHRPARQLQDLLILQDQRFALGARSLDVVRAGAPALCVDELLFLGAERLFDDRPMALIRQKALEYKVFIRVDGALHHVLAEPPCRIDDHDPGKAGLGIEREHHPGTGAVGANHLLDTDGQGDLQMIETVVLAVHDGAVGEQ